MFLVHGWRRWPRAPRFIEGATFQKTYNPNSDTFAHMFKGTTTGVCAFWNRAAAMQLTLAINPSKLQAFDTMGNQISIAGTTTSTIQVGLQRPTFLQCAIADYSAMDTAMSTATVTNVPAVISSRSRLSAASSDADRRIAHSGRRHRGFDRGGRHDAEGLACGSVVLGSGAGTEPVVYVRGACQSGCRPGARALRGPQDDNDHGRLRGSLERINSKTSP